MSATNPSPINPLSSPPPSLQALSNRAACYKQISNFDGTIEDCSAVLEAESNNVKALVRRAQAFEAVERYKFALQDVKQVRKSDDRYNTRTTTPPRSLLSTNTSSPKTHQHKNPFPPSPLA